MNEIVTIKPQTVRALSDVRGVPHDGAWIPAGDYEVILKPNGVFLALMPAGQKQDWYGSYYYPLEDLMYLTWETETMPEVKNSVLRIDDVRISIGPSACEPNEKWQHFSLTFGELTGKDHDDCQRDWPCRAIELARQKLDELEAKLGGPKTVFGERTL